MIRKQQQQHYPMRRCCLRLTDSQEIRQNHLKTAVAETDTTAVTAEVTAMETPAATDTVSVTNEEFYTAADGIVKISTEYKGETHTGYYLFDEEGILCNWTG